MAPNLHNANHNDAIRNYVMQRDNYRCQWPGCASKHKVEILFLLETSENELLTERFYQNGIMLCAKHMEIVNLHEKTFGPLVYDLIQLVEFESDLNETEKVYKDILKR